MPRLLEANHAALLPDPGESPAEWIHVLPFGEFAGRDGRGPYRVSDAQAVIAATSAYLGGTDMVIDYDHQILEAKQHSGPVPAAGWVKALEMRADGIWARVEWTPAAASALQAKEYRYFSPVFDYDTRTGEVARLKLGALTNVPNLQLQAAASRQGDAMNELLERLCYMLNLPLTTTAEEMSVQLDKLKALLTNGEAVVAAAAGLAAAVGLPVETEIAAVCQAIQSRLTQSPDPAQWVPKAQYDQVSHALADLQNTNKNAAADRQVQEAMTAGKIPPALKAWATEYASRNPEGFASYVASAPVLTDGAHSAGANPPAGAIQTLTPEEETVAHAMGLDTAAFLAAKKETAE